METVEAIRRVKCGMLHGVNSDTFVRVGYLYIGQGGGLLNNSDNIFCKQCFISFVQKNVKPPTVYREFNAS